MPQWQRFAIDPSAFGWRKQVAALLLVGGATLAIVVMGPSVVLRAQLLDVAPEIAGVERSIRPVSNPLIIDRPPEVHVIYNSLDRSEFALGDLLAERGFEEIDPGSPTDFPAQLRRPRGDSFLATVVELPFTVPDGGERPSFADIRAEDTAPFETARLLRNLGYAFVLIGAMLLWSETAISRYLRGTNAWPRHSALRERVGWVVVVCAAALAVGAISGTYVVVVLLVLALWWAGARLLVPQPPKRPDEVNEPDWIFPREK